MLTAFFGHKGRVASAANGSDSAPAEVVSQLVAALGLAGHHCDSYQISPFIQVELFKFFFDDFYFLEIRSGERSNYCQIQVVCVLGAFETLNLQAFGCDQQQFQSGSLGKAETEGKTGNRDGGASGV